MKFSLLQRTLFRKRTLKVIKSLISSDISLVGRLAIATELLDLNMIKSPEEYFEFLND